MRRGLVAVTAALGSVVACGGGSSSHGHTGSSASCAGPKLAISPAVAEAGDTVQAAGEWFAADCYDTGQPGSPPPLTALTLQVSQEGRVWTAASHVDATGSHYSFHVPIHLPEDLHPGTAEIAVKGYGAPVTLRVAPG